MIVEIDDAGVGSPVGGVVIAARKGDDFRHIVLPLALFRGDNDTESIKKEVKNAVIKLLEDLKFSKEEDEIFICQGDIFSEARKWFDENGIKYTTGQIVHPLQDYVETAFDLHLTTLGVPRELIRSFRDYRDYSFKLFKWVLLDIKEREKYVKTRFPSWNKKWKKAKLEKEQIKLRRKTTCLNCGGLIEQGSRACRVKIIVQDNTYYAFTHLECCRGENIVERTAGNL